MKKTNTKTETVKKVKKEIDWEAEYRRLEQLDDEYTLELQKEIDDLNDDVYELGKLLVDSKDFQFVYSVMAFCVGVLLTYIMMY